MANTIYEDRHEIEAEISARKIAIRQSDSAAIAHIENILSAFIPSLSARSINAFRSALAAIEDTTPEEKEVVQLFGELSSDGEQICGDADKDTGEVIKSKRQKWREELAALEEQLAAAPETPETPDPPEGEGD